MDTKKPSEAHNPERRPASLTPEREAELRNKARLVGLTPPEAAEYLGISTYGVTYHHLVGHLHPIALNNRMNVYLLDDLDALRSSPDFRKRGPRKRESSSETAIAADPAPEHPDE